MAPQMPAMTSSNTKSRRVMGGPPGRVGRLRPNIGANVAPDGGESHVAGGKSYGGADRGDARPRPGDGGEVRGAGAHRPRLRPVARRRRPAAAGVGRAARL